MTKTVFVCGFYFIFKAFFLLAYSAILMGQHSSALAFWPASEEIESQLCTIGSAFQVFDFALL